MRHTAAVRALDGVELPAPGIWTVDPGHTEVGFVGRHFMLTKVRGRFTGIDGTVTIGADPEESRVSVRIEMETVSSGNEARDEHLRSTDFFDVDEYPTASFESTAVVWSGSRGVITGNLTIKDVTQPVTLDVEYLGHARDPWGDDRAVFDAVGRIDREDWVLTWNVPLETGGFLVSKEIDLELHLELILAR